MVQYDSTKIIRSITTVAICQDETITDNIVTKNLNDNYHKHKLTDNS